MANCDVIQGVKSFRMCCLRKIINFSALTVTLRKFDLFGWERRKRKTDQYRKKFKMFSCSYDVITNVLCCNNIPFAIMWEVCTVCRNNVKIFITLFTLHDTDPGFLGVFFLCSANTCPYLRVQTSHLNLGRSKSTTQRSKWKFWFGHVPKMALRGLSVRRDFCSERSEELEPSSTDQVARTDERDRKAVVRTCSSSTAPLNTC